MEELIKKLNGLNFENDNEVKNFINNEESNMYSGNFNDGKYIAVFIEQGKEMSIHTESNNPNIERVLIYRIEEDNSLTFEEIYENN